MKLKFIILAASISCSYGFNQGSGTSNGLLMIKADSPPPADCRYSSITFDSLKSNNQGKLKVSHGC